MKNSILPSIFPVTCHTDFVGNGSTFVAIEGYNDNGINYIKKAIENGAHTIVVHRDSILDDALSDYLTNKNITLKRVENTRKELALLSAKAADHPAQKLKIIGITGTKGKTTTAFLLEHILTTAGYKTALISSAQNRICGINFASCLTTPQPDYLHQFLKACVEKDVEYVVMEVAAQALTLHRVEGISFCGIIFTNFSHEHLEFYPTLEDYFAAKKLIFNQVESTAPIVINYDNKWCKEFIESTNDSLIHTLLPYSVEKTLPDGITSLYDNHEKNKIKLAIKKSDLNLNIECSTLFGKYNAYNITAAVAMALELSIMPDTILQALQSFSGVPGRLQKYSLPNGAQCFIDYAHNPESFSVILFTLRELTDHLIVVFGAGGGRDKSKRPMMGSITSEIADIVIITSDNPRLEDPQMITQDIIDGIEDMLRSKVIIELDRKRAIELAYHLSDQSSIIALLGKGPDEYQIIGTKKEYFSEKTILQEL